MKIRKTIICVAMAFLCMSTLEMDAMMLERTKSTYKLRVAVIHPEAVKLSLFNEQNTMEETVYISELGNTVRNIWGGIKLYKNENEELVMNIDSNMASNLFGDKLMSTGTIFRSKSIRLGNTISIDGLDLLIIQKPSYTELFEVPVACYPTLVGGKFVLIK